MKVNSNNNNNNNAQPMLYVIIPQPIILLYLFQPFDLYFDVQKTLTV